ncbi:MAG: hypothetical protein SFX18_18635 [Pirellulales bacterium]|nr:hypothetical protein [Pirellulales bacterium]
MSSAQTPSALTPPSRVAWAEGIFDTYQENSSGSQPDDKPNSAPGPLRDKGRLLGLLREEDFVPPLALLQAAETLGVLPGEKLSRRGSWYEADCDIYELELESKLAELVDRLCADYFLLTPANRQARFNELMAAGEKFPRVRARLLTLLEGLQYEPQSPKYLTAFEATAQGYIQEIYPLPPRERAVRRRAAARKIATEAVSNTKKYIQEIRQAVAKLTPRQPALQQWTTTLLSGMQADKVPRGSDTVQLAVPSRNSLPDKPVDQATSKMPWYVLPIIVAAIIMGVGRGITDTSRKVPPQRNSTQNSRYTVREGVQLDPQYPPLDVEMPEQPMDSSAEELQRYQAELEQRVNEAVKRAAELRKSLNSEKQRPPFDDELPETPADSTNSPSGTDTPADPLDNPFDSPVSPPTDESPSPTPPALKNPFE